MIGAVTRDFIKCTWSRKKEKKGSVESRLPINNFILQVFKYKFFTTIKFVFIGIRIHVPFSGDPICG